jgi:hypothetical protein
MEHKIKKYAALAKELFPEVDPVHQQYFVQSMVTLEMESIYRLLNSQSVNNTLSEE